ncbi:conserved hypothetical protein [Mycoplasmopsis synoviae 53]|uniref:Uncharacterized protein n=1 Tax=Mycoplasmopsis synoviae (strain 53) TaxID=262723 RepID=Q4A585_MYCS5|nr:hypothetical protein [Mycoplasmopsis synoviae]AAZ44086.2 conserved hypothetical protein [Mycoplasmopsis synoviae 53]
MKQWKIDLINDYKKKIDEISKASLNKEQKELIIETLEHYSLKENCTEAKLKNLYSLLIQRVKVGFTFDTTPEIINKTYKFYWKKFIKNKSKNVIFISWSVNIATHFICCVSYCWSNFLFCHLFNPYVLLNKK